MQTSVEHKRTYRVYNWIGGHVRVVAVAALFVAIGLGVFGPMVANTEEANFDPDGDAFCQIIGLFAIVRGFEAARCIGGRFAGGYASAPGASRRSYPAPCS
jgi:hypothetical protein